MAKRTKFGKKNCYIFQNESIRIVLGLIKKLYSTDSSLSMSKIIKGKYMPHNFSLSLPFTFGLFWNLFFRKVENLFFITQVPPQKLHYTHAFFKFCNENDERILRIEINRKSCLKYFLHHENA